MNKNEKLSQILTKILNKKPGRRFLFAYLKLNNYINKNVFFKIILAMVGLLFTCLGLMMLILPGPGILFILVGIMMLCAGSRKIAVFLDKIEAASRGST